MTDYDEIHRLIATARHARDQAVAEMFADAMIRTGVALRRLAGSVAAWFTHLKDSRGVPSQRIAATSQR